MKWRSPSRALSPTSAAARSRSRRAACACGRCRPRATGRSRAGRCARNARCASRPSTHQHVNMPATAAALLPSSSLCFEYKDGVGNYKAPYERATKRAAVNWSVLIWPDTRTELVAARCTSARCCLLLLTDRLLMTSLASLIASLIAPLIPLLMSCLRCPLRCPL